MTLKNAALRALIGTILMTGLFVWTFVLAFLNVLGDLVPAVTVAVAATVPRHYFRYRVLFHRADYNRVATTTKTPAPKENDVSNPVSEESITCASCEYRYARSRAICPMCGTAAPAVEPVPPPSPVPDELRTNHKTLQSSLNSQPRPPRAGHKRLISIVVASIVLMVVSSVFYEVHKRNLAKESGSAAEPTATSPQPKVINADQRHIARNQIRRIQHVIPAKMETAQTPGPAKEDDPVELWKAVKRGNVSAEVALANLYLQGKSVPQSCEQAHMLLQTASTKGSKAADTLLKSSYAERCE